MAAVHGGMDLTELIKVIDSKGRELTPCKRKVADREVRLGRAKWIGRTRIRLRFDPFAYRYVRLRVLERDKHTCYWCGQPGFTMDHVIPWSKGGRTSMTNCICACEECNGRRGDMPASEFARVMGRPIPEAALVQTGGHLTAGAVALADPEPVRPVVKAVAIKAMPLPVTAKAVPAKAEAAPVQAKPAPAKPPQVQSCLRALLDPYSAAVSLRSLY